MNAAHGRGPGKVILLGEHSVVYGYPAVAAALQVGLQATAVPAAEPRLRVSPWGLDISLASPPPDHEGDVPADVIRAATVLFEAAPKSSRQANVTVEAEIPGKAGLGSSAALAVAVTRALAVLGGSEPSLSHVESVVGRTETIFHGRPSGIDAAVACRGGVLRFQHDCPPQRIPGPAVPVVLALVEPRASTRAMVAHVARQRRESPASTEKLLSRIGGLAESAVKVVSRADWPRLGHLMDRNDALLQQLGLGTPGLEAACQRARAAGALGAKMTGAGGGGCIVALTTPDRQSVVAEALDQSCRWVCQTTLGEPGDQTQ